MNTWVTYFCGNTGFENQIDISKGRKCLECGKSIYNVDHERAK